MTTYNKYNNGLIYIITCNDITITDSYIGSSINFKERLRKHKGDCENKNSEHYDKKLYKFIRSNNGWENFNMKVLIYYPCNNKKELEVKECEFIKDLKSTLNVQVPTQTRQEYRTINRETILIKKKEFREKNKEKIKQETKAYSEKNREILKQKAKEYREKNKIKISCTKCGVEYLKYNKSIHEKTIYHINTIL